MEQPGHEGKPRVGNTLVENICGTGQGAGVQDTRFLARNHPSPHWFMVDLRHPRLQMII